MISFTQIHAHPPSGVNLGALILPFELRQKSRFLAHLASGEAISVILPRGHILRAGNWLHTDAGQGVQVQAAPETLLRVTASDTLLLTRAAYHLGNRHVALEIGLDYLHLCQDSVLAQLLQGLGLTVAPCTAPFEPEAGAYGSGGQHHAHAEPGSTGAHIHHYES